MLNEIASVGRQTFMAELQPGAEYADHDHDQDEEIYVISGDLIIGEIPPKILEVGVSASSPDRDLPAGQRREYLIRTSGLANKIGSTAPSISDMAPLMTDSRMLGEK